MRLRHVALFCRSEENSDKFYGEILGLNKEQTKTVPSSLSKQIFNIEQEFKIVNYAKGDVRFEVFIGDSPPLGDRRIDHVCIEVDDLPGFLDKCKSSDVRILDIPREGPPLIFIWDFDGNSFEVKESSRR